MFCVSPLVGQSSSERKRWVPPHSLPRDVSSRDWDETIFRKTRSILNKITPEKFDRLCQEILNIGIDSKAILKGIVSLIFGKAIDELCYSSLYANLCRRLYYEAPNFDKPIQPSSGASTQQPNTFLRFLIANLQDEFENRNKKLEAFDKKLHLTEEEEELRKKAKQHMLGNIKFIGELYRLNLLQESILHQCIKQLINKKKNSSIQDIAEDLECLCQIMMTCGKRLDHERARKLMNQYFDRLESLQKRKGEFPTRVRFMLQDVIELRANKWKPRQILRSQDPKTLGQIRSEVSEKYPHLLFDPSMITARENNVRIGGQQNYENQNDSQINEDVLEKSGFDFFTSTAVNKPEANRKIEDDPINVVNVFAPSYLNMHLSVGGKQNAQADLNSSLNRHPYTYTNQAKIPSTMEVPLFKNRGKEVPPRFLKQQFEANCNINSQSDVINSSLPPGKKYIKDGKNLRNQKGMSSSLKTNIKPATADLFQPPFQHVIDSAKQKPARKVLETNKKVGQDKNSKSRKSVLSQKDVEVMAQRIVDDFFLSKNPDFQFYAASIKSFDSSRKHMQDLVNQFHIKSLEQTEENRTNLCKFLTLLLAEKILTRDHQQEAISHVLEKLSDLESEISRIKTISASLIARLVTSDLVTLKQVADQLVSGRHFPLFLLILQHMIKIKDKEWLGGIFKECKINMQIMMPEVSTDTYRMLEVLEGKKLGFLFPLLHLETQLSLQLEENPSPSVIYRWIKDNVEVRFHSDPEFIRVLMSCCLHFITKKSSLAPQVDQNASVSKDVQEVEKQFLINLKPILQKFVHDSQKLQLHSIYAVQVFCHCNNFPKGLMLRLFNHLYNEDVIDEEVFIMWKENVNDLFPGKGKALFQVNAWLTWLEEADTEDEEEEN